MFGVCKKMPFGIYRIDKFNALVKKRRSVGLVLEKRIKFFFLNYYSFNKASIRLRRDWGLIWINFASCV